MTVRLKPRKAKPSLKVELDPCKTQINLKRMLTKADIKKTRRVAKAIWVKTKSRVRVSQAVAPVCLSDYTEVCTLVGVMRSHSVEVFKCFVKSNYILYENPNMPQEPNFVIWRLCLEIWDICLYQRIKCLRSNTC